MGDLSLDSSEFLRLDGAATACTIMGGIGNGHKVRCHKGAVENLIPLRRFLKNSASPVCPRAPVPALPSMELPEHRGYVLDSNFEV